jgi:N-acetyl-gamma-glutamyl-phosphate reductase
MGGSGYGGAEMIRRLLVHPAVELVRVASGDAVGRPVSSVHLSLEGQTDLRFEKLTPAEVAQGVDIVLLGLPHGVSSQVVPALVAAGVRIIDLSGDFRIQSIADYETFYGLKHPCPELVPQFVYGLPEANREAIRGARYVASPGCFATTIELGLLPLARAGWLEGEVSTVAITGSSGSGVAPQPTTHHPVRAGNLRTYKPLVHQQLPETREQLGRAGARALDVRFVPVSAPLVRGLWASSFVTVPAEVTPPQLHAAFAECYGPGREPFVRLPKGRLPEVVAVAGSCYAEVGLEVGGVAAGRRQLTVFSALDNVVKGGAGQAVQCLNLMVGVDETTTLTDPGGWP